MKSKYNILICFLVIISVFFVFPFSAKADDEYKVCTYKKTAWLTNVYGTLHVVNGKVVFDVYRDGVSFLGAIQLTGTVEKTCSTVYTNDSKNVVFSAEQLLSSCPQYVYEVKGTGVSTEIAWLKSPTVFDGAYKYALTSEVTESEVGKVNDELAYGFTGTSHDVTYTSKISGECPTDVGVFKLLGIAYRYIKILAPILMLLFGSIDFAKAAAAGDEKEMSKAQKAFSRRLVAAVIVFLVFVMMDFIIGITSNGSEVMECVGSILN